MLGAPYTFLGLNKYNQRDFEYNTSANFVLASFQTTWMTHPERPWRQGSEKWGRRGRFFPDKAKSHGQFGPNTD